jgi:Reverse transcriptase (RNA-dependent DNA polymerase)
MNPILFIFNLSLHTGVVPEKLKVAKAIPIYKKGDSSLPSNYRPISLLSIINKMLEKITHKRLYSYLNKHNILYSHQFGSRQNRSTILALLEVTDNTYESLDNHDINVGIRMDLQKAFDTVNHDILLHKMHCYGVRGIVHD